MGAIEDTGSDRATTPTPAPAPPVEAVVERLGRIADNSFSLGELESRADSDPSVITLKQAYVDDDMAEILALLAQQSKEIERHEVSNAAFVKDALDLRAKLTAAREAVERAYDAAREGKINEDVHITRTAKILRTALKEIDAATIMEAKANTEDET